VEKPQNRAWKITPKCEYAAPYICYQSEDKTWRISQGCCNHWDCARCGEIRAKQEYARIVQGAEKLEAENHALYFHTITCRGKEVTAKEAEDNYLNWTDKLMTATRNKATRAGQYWCYVQVTERQKRGHPHSHILTTFCPDDAIAYPKGAILPNSRYARHDCLWSEWFRAANVRAGLGVECDISRVKSARAVGIYIAKYLTKASMLDTWPPRWKRVRYSQSWPDLPDLTNNSAFPVIKFYDWMRVADIRDPVRADSVYTYAAAQARGVPNVIPPAW
jgi:hypothetical protein